jgi:hypothetical protein
MKRLIPLCALLSCPLLAQNSALPACTQMSGPFVTGSLLYWQASVNDLHPVAQSSLSNTNVLNFRKIPFRWHLGFKAGLGFQMKKDWDVYLNWTHFQSHSSKSYSTSLPHIFVTILAIESILAQEAHARWELHFDSLDLEFGRKFLVGSNFSLRPHGGVKGARIRPSLEVDYRNNLENLLPQGPSDLRIKDPTWAVGPRLGINSRYGSRFGFLANGAISLLWNDKKSRYNNFIVDTQNNAILDIEVKKNLKFFEPVFEGFLGLDFQACPSKNMGLSFSAGYEVQIWLNQIRWFSFAQFYNNRNLNFQGLTATLKLNF